MFVLSDGQEAELVRGERVPFPRRSVSNQGTVTTQGFEFVQTGFKTQLTLRETSASAASLKVQTELSTISRFVETAPVTSVESIQTTAVMESAGVYLLGALEREDNELRETTWLHWGEQTQRQDRLLQLWSKASESETAYPAAPQHSTVAK